MKGNRKKRSVHIPVTRDGKEKKGPTKTPPAKKPAPAEEAAPPGEKALEYDDMLDTLQRLKAEYANYQKRIEREREEYRETCLRDVFLRVLPVMDNLERAIAAAREHGSSDELLSGVELILKQFRQVLAAEGVAPFDSIGEKFDPRYHDALMVQETDKAPPETVISEVQRGYTIGDKVLRAAKVTVSRKPQEKA
jgi:molecular chaperone GrpE